VAFKNRALAHSGFNMTLTQRYVLLLCFAAFALAGCGGGASNGAATPSPVTPPAAVTATASQLEAQVSAAQLDSSSTGAVTVSVIAKNESNAVVPGVVVTFSASSGNLTVLNATTDVDGKAVASLTVGANKSNRIITVAAAAKGVSTSTSIDVRGTTLAISTPPSVGLGSPVVLNASLKDSSGNPIAYAPVNFSSRLGNGTNKVCTMNANCTTDASGSLVITYTPTVVGVDVVTLSSFGAIATQNITAANSALSITIAQDVGGATNEFSVNQSSKSMVVSLTGGVTYPASISLTSTIGTVTPNVVTISNAGSTASAVLNTGVSVAQGLISAQHVVSGGGGAYVTVPFEVVSRVASNVSLQASPSVIANNLNGSTVSKSQLIATVRDAVGNPVKNANVSFSMPVNASGGLGLQTANALTDASGVATNTYTAGPNSASGVSNPIYANVNGVAVAGVTNITVAQQALYVNIGVSNLVIVDNSTTYSKEFSVSVTDAAGRAVSGVSLSAELKADGFYKGQMRLVKADGTLAGPTDTAVKWAPFGSYCVNENTNHNGTIEAGEDINGNGRLDPGVRPILTQVSGGVLPNTTNQSGLAMYKISYFKSDAVWSEYILTVTTNTTQGGAQGVAAQLFTLKMAVTDATDVSVGPPNLLSPFGSINSSCASAL
jgi:Bacterial Ig-like domain (group 1)